MSRDMKYSNIEWINEIPMSWRTAKIKNTFERKKSKPTSDDYNILSLARSGIKIRDISTGEGQIASDYSHYNPVVPGDILLNPMDLVSGDNSNISEVEGVISQAYFNLKAKNGYNPYFYNYYFKLQYWLGSFFSHGKGVSFKNRWTLNADTVRNFPVVIPSLEEQNMIVNYLDDNIYKIENLVGKTRQSIEELKAYKQSLITETVTKGLDPEAPMKDSGIEWIGKLPNHWKLTRLKNVYNLNKGLTITKANLQDEGIPVVSYGDIHSRYGFKFNPEINPVKCVDERYLEKYPLAKLERGNFVFADTSEDLEGSGNFTVFDSDVITLAGYHTIVLKPRLEVNYKFIAYLFDSQAYRQQIQQLMQGVKVNSISQRILKNTTIWFPSDEEQTEIVNFLNEKTNAINGLINKKEKTIKELESYKQSLIYEYVTGKKEVE